jgi:hypothetical protein
VENGLFDVGDASLVNPQELLICAVEAFPSGKTLYFREVCHGI